MDCDISYDVLSVENSFPFNAVMFSMQRMYSYKDRDVEIYSVNVFHSSGDVM